MDSDAENADSAINREAALFHRAKKRLTSTLLVLFPATMIGREVCVTLLDDTEVTGRLAFVDGFLNVQLDSCVTVRSPLSANQPTRTADGMSICGKRVRYIGLPGSLDVKQEIQSYLTRKPLENKTGQRRFRKDKYAYLRDQFKSN